MTLVEGEVIEQIEEIDEGWWSGVGEGGTKSGLFPCMCALNSMVETDVECGRSQLCGTY